MATRPLADYDEKTVRYMATADADNGYKRRRWADLVQVWRDLETQPEPKAELDSLLDHLTSMANYYAESATEAKAELEARAADAHADAAAEEHDACALAQRWPDLSGC